MALDQFHEQSIKGDSGIVGVIEDPSTIHAQLGGCWLDWKLPA